MLLLPRAFAATNHHDRAMNEFGCRSTAARVASGSTLAYCMHKLPEQRQQALKINSGQIIICAYKITSTRLSLIIEGVWHVSAKAVLGLTSERK